MKTMKYYIYSYAALKIGSTTPIYGSSLFKCYSIVELFEYLSQQSESYSITCLVEILKSEYDEACKDGIIG